MKTKEIIEMSTDELLTKRRDLRQESLHLRWQQQSGQLEQPRRLRLLRRDVARIETVLSQRAAQTVKTSIYGGATTVASSSAGAAGPVHSQCAQDAYRRSD